MIRALRSTQLEPQKARVLDVGCGEGASLWLLLRLGFEPSQLFGVDIQEDRIRHARAKNSLLTFDCGDATALSFPDSAFDITMESTMFMQLTDEEVASRVAAEMVRVTKPGGKLLLSDWRYAKPGDLEYKALSRSRVTRLFQVGTSTRLCGTSAVRWCRPLDAFFPPIFPRYILWPRRCFLSWRVMS